ncbi:MAG: type I-MYXAN CRISPR-associated protein Cas6/Cmx6 [Burkholderiaceae bacterium]
MSRTPSDTHPTTASTAPASSDEVCDLSFELVGRSLPADYADALWGALTARAPWLADEPTAGMHPLRTSANGRERLLTRRTKLMLRVPRARLQDALRLCGTALDIEGRALSLGDARPRSLQASATVGAAFVAGDSADELTHHDRLRTLLSELDLPDHAIFGRMTECRIAGRAVAGSSMVIHRLRPEQSMRVQLRGLGPYRSHGCGLFVPYKLIDGLD